MNRKRPGRQRRPAVRARFDNPEFGRLVYRRLKVAITIVVLVWAVLAARALVIQVVWAERLGQKAIAQIRQTVAVPAPRGEIRDRHSQPLTVNWHNESFFTYPNAHNITPLAKNLSSLLVCSEQDIRQDLYNKRGDFAWLIRQADDRTAEKIRRWKIAGIHSLPEMTRAYTNGGICGGVVGYVDTDNRGLAGIEYSCDKWLTGTDGTWILWRDGLGRKYSYDPVRLVEPIPGCSVELTLDLGWQMVLEEELTRGVEEYGARSGMAVLLDCRTGEVLAMADAFSAQDEPSDKNTKCRVVSDVFEPGSSFKLVAYATALSKGPLCPADSFDAEMGRARFSNRFIRDDKKHGYLTLADAFRLSSNIVTGRMANIVGGETLRNWARRFGFGSLTGILLPAEQRGSVPRHSWSEYMTAAFSIGHGVSVTTLQLAVAYAGLANGGLLMKPYLVSSITDANGQVVYRHKPKVVRRIMTPVVAAELLAMARNVVTDGTAKPVHDPQFPIAGKTGTAEKPDLQTGRMLKNKYIASFAGFWPADNPRLVGVVVLDEPEPIHYGGWTAAPVLLNTFRRGSCVKNPGFEQRPYLMASSSTMVEPAIPVKADRTVAGYSAPETSFWQRHSCLVVDPDKFLDGAIPDVIGFTARDAVAVLKKCGYEAAITGLGKVIRQNPAPGSKISMGTD
jgi:cell division protein FtsI (penicillin-binding protein 3)